MCGVTDAASVEFIEPICMYLYWWHATNTCSITFYTQKHHVKVLEDWGTERMRYINNSLNIQTHSNKTRAYLCIAPKTSRKFWNVCFSFGLHQSVAMKADIWFFIVNRWIHSIYLISALCIWLFIDTSRFVFVGSRTFLSYFSEGFFSRSDDGSALHVVNCKMNNRMNYTHIHSVRTHQTWNIGLIINLLYEYSQSWCDGKVCLCCMKCISVCAPR